MLVYCIFENDELIWARNYYIENEKEGQERIRETYNDIKDKVEVSNIKLENNKLEFVNCGVEKHVIFVEENKEIEKNKGIEEIKNKIKNYVPIWKGVYNDTTDRLFGILTEIKGVKNQYEEFKSDFVNYYRTLKENQDYIFKYLAFFYLYKDGNKLVDYAIKDIYKNL